MVALSTTHVWSQRAPRAENRLGGGVLKTIVILVLLGALSPSALAEEPAQTSAACPTNKEREEKLKKLLEARKVAAQRYEDRAAIPKALDLTNTAILTLSSMATGVGLAGALTLNLPLIFGGLACSGCGYATAATVEIIKQAAFDHRKDDLDALVKAEEEFKEAAMTF